MTTLSIVVAVAENGVIGRDNALPWRLPTDLKRFRALTWGKPMIMGRRNWDSIGRPLPGRETVVLSRQHDFRPEGASVARSWDEAKTIAGALAGDLGASEIAIVGGAEIYRLAMPEAERVYLTRVHARSTGDVVFPEAGLAAFREARRERHEAGDTDEHAFTFIDLIRAQPSAAIAAAR